MDNNYFDFLGQNSVAGNDNSNAGSNNDKGKVNLTVRVDADCQVVCDGDFLFLANANQIVKDKAPMGQHLLNFTSLDYPDATIEKIVDFPVEGNNYLIVVNELKEKVELLQKEKEESKQAKLQEEEEKRRVAEDERLRMEQEKERNAELEKAMDLFKKGEYSEAKSLFEKNEDYLNEKQKSTYDECRIKAYEKFELEEDLATAMSRYKNGKYSEAKKHFDYHLDSLNSEQKAIYNECVAKIEEEQRIKKMGEDCREASRCWEIGKFKRAWDLLKGYPYRELSQDCKRIKDCLEAAIISGKELEDLV